jgi:glycosyltransferase involved in cell wall biosynthesis
MHVCFICVESFAWGKYGGFGRATRIIANGLVKRGVTVSVVVPGRQGQKPVEPLDGFTVYSFPRGRFWSAQRLLRDRDADIYHSSEPSLETWFAQRATPERKHVITVRDPRDFQDWRMEFALPSLNRLQVAANYLYEANALVSRAVRRADAVYATANCLIPKIRRMYRLREEPAFLPTPTAIPPAVRKASTPTVCYMARLDRRKRPEIFLELANEYPDVAFILAGQSRSARYHEKLLRSYRHPSNLEITGFVDPFSSERHSEILGRSWIMVNCATREALPNSFLEASAHRCAILSEVDPDGFASKFGCRVDDGDFRKGLEFLLKGDNWRSRGERGFEHVSRTFESEEAIDRHVEAYERLLGMGD